MKDTFFTLVAISIPLVFLAGLIYMFGQGLVTVARDWHERREMTKLRREIQSRRQQEKSPKAAATSNESEGESAV